MSTHLISLKHSETDNELLYKVKQTATAAAHIFSTFPHLGWLHSSDSKVSCLTVWPRCQATSLTRESVSVPQQSHEPGTASEFSRLWRETLRTDQRGLCAEKWTCQCAVSVWCCFFVKLKPFAYIFFKRTVGSILAWVRDCLRTQAIEALFYLLVYCCKKKCNC